METRGKNEILTFAARHYTYSTVWTWLAAQAKNLGLRQRSTTYVTVTHQGQLTNGINRRKNRILEWGKYEKKNSNISMITSKVL